MNKKPYSSYQRGITNYRAANLFDECFVLRMSVMRLCERCVMYFEGKISKSEVK